MQKLKQLIIIVFLVLSVDSLYAQDTDYLVDSMQKKLRVTPEDSTKVDIYIELGNLVSYYDAATAAGYVEEGLTLSQKISYRNGIGRCSYLLGFIYQDLNNYVKSSEMLNLAEQIAGELNQRDLTGKVHNARGTWFFLQSDMYNASYHFSKARETFQEIGDTAREIAAYQNLIACLGEVKSYERAVKLSEQMLTLLRQRNDTLQIGYTLNHLMVNYLGLRKTDDAKKYVAELLSILQKKKDFGLSSDSYDVIGDYYFATGQVDSSISFYRKALETSLRKDHQSAQSNLSLGLAFLKKGEYDRAYSHLSEALELSRSTNTMDVYYRVCHALSDYYKEIGDIPNAYYYLSNYVTLNDSILVEETRQYANYLDAVYETQKKEKAISDLKLANSQKELDLIKRNRLLLMGGAGSGFAVLVLGLLYRNSRNKTIIAEKDQMLKAEQIKMLEGQAQVITLKGMVDGQETERTRIAKDLHDGLGGLFSTIKMHFSSLQHGNQALQENPLFLKSYDLVNTASEEVRRIAHNMMPEVLIRIGLMEATRDLCNSISAGGQTKVSLQSFGMEQRLAASTEIMLFRIIQELLNNVIKHASASEAIVQFNRQDDRLSLTVEDNGKGFNPQMSGNGANAGLSSVASRVQYLNGNISIDSRENVGTTIMIDIVLDDSKRSAS